MHTRQKLNTLERRTCAVLGLSRSSLRYQAKPQNDDALRLATIRLAKQYGRYAYRKGRPGCAIGSSNQRATRFCGWKVGRLENGGPTTVIK